MNATQKKSQTNVLQKIHHLLRLFILQTHEFSMCLWDFQEPEKSRTDHINIQHSA